LLARFDLGRSPLQRAPLDFSALIDEAGEDAGLLAAPKGLRVRTEIAPGIRVDGDGGMLRRVAHNLIDNAVRYNRDGGDLCLILVEQRAEAVFTIGNHGPGIPADRQGALFERFFRLGSDRNRTTGGSGLGLSLCREIMAAHGGCIELARSGDDWTEFRVRLPALGSGDPAARPGTGSAMKAVKPDVA
jgi:signal transduction histidine kinase